MAAPGHREWGTSSRPRGRRRHRPPLLAQPVPSLLLVSATCPRGVTAAAMLQGHTALQDGHDQVCVRGQAWLFVTFPCLSRYPKQLRAPRSSAGGWESDAKEADVPAGALCPPCRRRLSHRRPGLCVAGVRSSGAGPVAGSFACLVSWGVRRGLSGLTGSLGHGGV